MTDKKTEALKLALEALEAQHNDRTAYSKAKRSANATCGEFKNNPLNELIESGYMHELGKQTEFAITAIREALAEQPAQQQDLPDFIAGALGVSRGTAYDMMRDALAQQQEPIYQMQMMDGKWIDQAKHSYEYNKKHGNTVRVLYTSPPAQQQEPVAWATRMGEYAHIHWGAKRPEYPMVYEVPLYTSPPASKPWVGLTDEEIETAMPSGIYDCLADPWDCGVGDGDEMRSIKNDVVRIARAIEAKLREKNA